MPTNSAISIFILIVFALIIAFLLLLVYTAHTLDDLDTSRDLLSDWEQYGEDSLQELDACHAHIHALETQLHAALAALNQTNEDWDEVTSALRAGTDEVTSALRASTDEVTSAIGNLKNRNEQQPLWALASASQPVANGDLSHVSDLPQADAHDHQEPRSSARPATLFDLPELPDPQRSTAGAAVALDTTSSTLNDVPSASARTLDEEA